MPRPKKTTAQLDATREQILDAALDILQASGPEAISIRAIADHLGVAHMSLYTYFENQADILRALRERELAKWRAEQQLIAARADHVEIGQIVDEMLGLFIAFARENPNLYRLAWVMPEVGAESVAENRQRTQATVGQLAQLLKLGMERGVFQLREPMLAAGVVLAMVNMPHILFHSGKVIDPVLRDRMVVEMRSAVRLYLIEPASALAQAPG